MPKFVKYLRTWERLEGLLLKLVPLQNLTIDACTVFLRGYALNHDGYYYGMNIIDTGKMYNTRDVT